MSTRKRSDEDFDREIRAHIELETERLIDDGMPPADAKDAARRRFGNVTVARERFYETGRLLWLDHLVQDLRCAARNLRRYPIASLVAVLSLAAGIGATTVTLTIRDVIFRKPPPLYQRPGELSKVQIGSPASPIMPIGSPVPVTLYQRWRETIGPSMAAYTSLGVREIRTGEGFFSTLGVPMRAGRAFSAADSSAGRIAIVNETLARQLFAGRIAVGARLWIAKVPYEIVGVVADYARHPLRAALPEPRVFVPLAPDSKDVTRMHFLVRAEGDPAALVQTVRSEVRKVAAGTTVGSVETVDQMIHGMSRETMIGTAPLFPLATIGILLTTAGIYGVLAFAIARRSRELAVRVAVGASASDIVRLVTAHTVRLIAVGSTLGLVLMFGLARVVRAGGGAGSIWDPALHSFVVPVVVVVVVGALATWIPSRRALKIDPVVLLRSP